MIDKKNLAKESSNDLEVAFVEALPTIVGDFSYTFIDPKSLTNGQGSSINSTTLPKSDEILDVLGFVSKIT